MSSRELYRAADQLDDALIATDIACCEGAAGRVSWADLDRIGVAALALSEQAAAVLRRG